MAMSNTEISAETRCLRCHRRLTRSQGYGPVCRARIRAAAQTAPLTDFTSAQVEKARELISDGGLVPTSRAGVYRSVSSDGVTVYLTHFASCTCRAGLRSIRCYHVAGARILSAAAPVRRAA
jgi:hypothetical protein